ncbi:peptidase M48 [Taibaiella sp. KBW10]|uniref:M48 family metallopeptidase n=1 Tax=Taibaiella sp. KBW10 TaxID=2153357 RepID=UPI000F5AE9E4|nr:M48 family metallopeptidase [Taibaiella sp. KBW10]RQO30202.1 peptidase M48 [Taibaiella sp. KBW10]
MNGMYKPIGTLLVASLMFLATGCFKNPTTGRRSLNLVPEGTLSSLSGEQYSTFLAQNKRLSGTNDALMVQRVGNKLAAGIVQYYAQKGQSSILNGFKWEFNLVQDVQKNAFCMPGGKVVIYTGILPVTKDETGLAVVMSHEIAHAIARHGNERMSQGLLQQFGGLALNVALSSKPEETRNLFNTAYGVGTSVGVMLPFSRKHETEADLMGLDFMAMAGYNPGEAVGFWQRMASGAGAKQPELLSTHPSDATRIQNIQKHLPQALAIYSTKK